MIPNNSELTGGLCYKTIILKSVNLLITESLILIPCNAVLEAITPILIE